MQPLIAPLLATSSNNATTLWLMIAGLAIGTFAIRMTGAVVGQRLPTEGPWARALNALPGCLILSLIVTTLARGGPLEWIAASVALATALVTRNLPVTMIAGVGAIYVLRNFGG